MSVLKINHYPTYACPVLLTSLKIAYVKQEELPLSEKTGPSTGSERQQKIDGALDSDLDTGCTSCNAGLPVVDGKHESGEQCTARCLWCKNGIPLSADNPQVHENGEECPIRFVEPAGEAPLASASVMGGSHQRRARKNPGPTVQ